MAVARVDDAVPAQRQSAGLDAAQAAAADDRNRGGMAEDAARARGFHRLEQHGAEVGPPGVRPGPLSPVIAAMRDKLPLSGSHHPMPSMACKARGRDLFPNAELLPNSVQCRGQRLPRDQRGNGWPFEQNDVEAVLAGSQRGYAAGRPSAHHDHVAMRHGKLPTSHQAPVSPSPRRKPQIRVRYPCGDRSNET